MDILAKRSFRYIDEKGNSGEVVLSIQTPYPTEHKGVPRWEGDYTFGPPIGKGGHAVGVDFFQVLISSLQIARGYLTGYYPDGRVEWQGRMDCGLPWHTEAQRSDESEAPSEEPNEDDLRRMATRELGYQDDHGTTQMVPLSIFEPIAKSDRLWKCGVAFDYVEGAALRYGRGLDAIEAMLDALAIARLVFSSRRAKGNLLKDADLLDCEDFPQKINGAFWLVRSSAEESTS